MQAIKHSRPSFQFAIRSFIRCHANAGAEHRALMTKDMTAKLQGANATDVEIEAILAQLIAQSAKVQREKAGGTMPGRG
jgi:hypothetical protein